VGAPSIDETGTVTFFYFFGNRYLVIEIPDIAGEKQQVRINDFINQVSQRFHPAERVLKNIIFFYGRCLFGIGSKKTIGIGNELDHIERQKIYCFHNIQTLRFMDL